MISGKLYWKLKKSKEVDALIYTNIRETCLQGNSAQMIIGPRQNLSNHTTTYPAIRETAAKEQKLECEKKCVDAGSYKWCKYIEDTYITVLNEKSLAKSK